MDNQLKKGVSDFMKPMQEVTCRTCIVTGYNHDSSSQLRCDWEAIVFQGTFGDCCLSRSRGERFGLDASIKQSKVVRSNEYSAGLEPKQRSLINIALLASQGKAEEVCTFEALRPAASD